MVGTNRLLKLAHNEKKEGKAKRIKGSSYAVGKAPEDLNDRQKETIHIIRVMTPRYYRAYDIKETLRHILKMDNHEGAKAPSGNVDGGWCYRRYASN